MCYTVILFAMKIIIFLQFDDMAVGYFKGSMHYCHRNLVIGSDDGVPLSNAISTCKNNPSCKGLYDREGNKNCPGNKVLLCSDWRSHGLPPGSAGCAYYKGMNLKLR